jgi:peptide/nickel transport system ATP-binding protein
VSLLKVEALSVRFSTRGGMVEAVRDVSLAVAAGETLGVVGESGSGKSVTALAAMGLLDRAGRVTAGRILFRGKDITRASRKTLEPLRGAAMAMVFQNARAALNPIRTVGRQIADVLRAHSSVTHRGAAERAVALLEEVRIRDPHRRVHAYPHELSGGMCQRVMIALATACDPALLIADEPTTGLDVTTQKAVMDLLAERTAARGMALVLITHDLGLAAQYCGRVMVMEAGRVVETSPPAKLFQHPTHPYTRRLVAASPTRTSTVEGLLLPQLSLSRPSREREK